MADNRSNSSPTDPPASNQGQDEPVPSAPEESGQAGSTDAVREAEETATLPSREAGGVPTPGDAQGVVVPSVEAAAGSSEQGEPVEDVTEIARAAPGKPDGEVDTRA